MAWYPDKADGCRAQSHFCRIMQHYKERWTRFSLFDVSFPVHVTLYSAPLSLFSVYTTQPRPKDSPGQDRPPHDRLTSIQQEP